MASVNFPFDTGDKATYIGLPTFFLTPLYEYDIVDVDDSQGTIYVMVGSEKITAPIRDFIKSGVDKRKPVLDASIVMRENREDELKEQAFTRFDTGAVRDSQEGKPDFIEIFPWLFLSRYARYMMPKQKKYGAGNFKKGIPKEQYLRSAIRHWQKLMAIEECISRGITPPPELEPDEDHVSAIIFNLIGYAFECELERINQIKLTAEELKELQAPILK